VNDAAVTPGLVRGELAFFLDNNDSGFRESLDESEGGGQTYDATAHDRVVKDHLLFDDLPVAFANFAPPAVIFAAIAALVRTEWILFRCSFVDFNTPTRRFIRVEVPVLHLGHTGEDLASPSSLAFEAKVAGLDGVVVSGDDVEDVRAACGEEFCLVVPGIRPAGSNGHDQVRILTPAEAIESGADYLVIGRPLTEAADPVGVVRGILRDLR
jgi:hypothetical protein